MGRIEVAVTYDQNTRALTISDQIEIPYGQGDWVEWKFLGIPPGSFGYLHFRNAPRFGPFHSLRSSGGVVVGKGNIGTSSETPLKYGYKAMLLDRTNGVLAVSQEGTVLQHTAPKDTTPDVTVTYQGENQPLLVEPYRLRLNVGDTAVWHFLDFPPGYFTTLQFDSAEGNPFTDFYITAPLPGQPTGTFRANGIGFAEAGTPAKDSWLNYHVQVRDSTGKIVSNDDPVIDNLGPPIPD
jgi:hypothetical protein